MTGLAEESPARSFVEWGLAGICQATVFATLSAVCYDRLRDTGSPPAPAPAAPAVA